MVEVLFKNRGQQPVNGLKRTPEEPRAVGYTTGRSERRGMVSDTSATGEPRPSTETQSTDPIIGELASGSGHHRHTIVSSEATWEGKLHTEASARIEGRVAGEIEAGDTIFIAQGAQVRANVQARHVIVAGQLEGEVTCREQLVVEQSGRLAGKVSTKTIVIAEGAIVQSQIQMLRGHEPAPAAVQEHGPHSVAIALPSSQDG